MVKITELSPSLYRIDDYVVDLLEETCTCPAFRRGIRPCKHILAVKEHVKILPFNGVFSEV